MRKSQLCHYCVGINKVEVLFTKGFILKLQENNLLYFAVVGTKLLGNVRVRPGIMKETTILVKKLYLNVLKNKSLRALIEGAVFFTDFL